MADFRVKDEYYRFSTVTGLFLQDESLTDPPTFDLFKTNMGLIDRAYDTDSSIESKNLTQWQRFAHKVKSMNKDAPANTRYVLLYLARHGEGWHNRAETKYATKDWDCYWSTLDGDGESTWSDALLTPTGISQALALNELWKKEIVEQSVLLPDKFIVSPLDRCCQTAQLTWSGIELPQHPFEPLIMEQVRECIGIHTCDRRSSKSRIQSRYPFEFEVGFAEEDPLWLPDLRESDSAMTARLKNFLDDILRHNDATVFSITSHSGSVAAMLRALSHREFPLNPGGLIPVFIKAELVAGREPPIKVDPWITKPEC